MTTRTFTPEQLDEIGVPNELGEDGCATELRREQVDSRRWVSVHELIFRAPDDGRAYRVYYERPLTEHQECDTWPGNEIQAVEVEERPFLHTRWEPITAPRSGQPDEDPALRHLTEVYGEAGHRDRDAQQYAAELLAKHTRELAELLRGQRAAVYEDAGQRTAEGVTRAVTYLEAYARGLTPDA